MLVSEAQRLGALAVLTASLAVYGISLFHTRELIRETSLPWGNQGPGLMTVEVAGDPAKGGIYFLPKGVTFETIRGIAEIPVMNNRGKMENVLITNGAAILISPQGEVKIEEMEASKKLALGLPIDLNLASEEELSLVPGIGEKMAIQIIQLRKRRGSFQNLSELTAVPGIKDKKLDVFRGYLFVIAAP